MWRSRRGDAGPAGYRGMAVGYPERINLAFDCEQMNLRWIWKGEFVNADPGRFSPRGTDRIEFPVGIPFHRLASMDDHWPYKGKTDYLFPFDHGYQFRGYRLGAGKRPTFMYHYGDVKVEDGFEDRLDEESGAAYFLRTIRFETDAPAEPFHFRAAAGKEVEATESGYRIDRLRLVLPGARKGVIREGEPMELLVPLALPAGESKLELEYRW